MNRAPLIAGNWKMHKSAGDAHAFIFHLKQKIEMHQRRVLLAVPFTVIQEAADAANGTSIAIGGQNMHDHLEGAFTGEISARMLKSSGATFVLLGHSERRQYFGETNAFIHRKVRCALQENLTPILCIGELAQERESGAYENVLTMQLEECLHDLSTAEAQEVVIAYEPVWAIGTGKTATPEIAQAVHFFIRNWLSSCFGMPCAEKISLLYGGSVKPDNIAELMRQSDIDGVLVGGASLEVDTFARIINYSL